VTSIAKYLAVFSVLLTFTACGSSKVSEKTTDANKDNEAFVLTFTDVMEFIRGAESTYSISGNFTGETNSPITIDGLPETASFDGSNLTWLPPCDLKPENGQFIRGYLVRRLRITMKSKLSDSIVQRPAILIVHKDGDVPICAN
jgi:hypothetical protein